MKKKKSPQLKLTKETPEERRKRVSCGINFRSVVFENKRRKQQVKNGRKILEDELL